MTILRTIGRTVFLPTVLPLPMLANGVADLDQPGAVLGNFQKVSRGKILGTIGRRVAQRLEQPGMNQRRYVVRLAVQHPACLLRRQADGQLSHDRQEPKLFFFHAKSVACPT